MYIRMADGRERGQVLDMVDEVGRAMLANGQALPVDFTEPDALEARELKAIEPEPVASEVPKIQVQNPPGKPPGGFGKRRR